MPVAVPALSNTVNARWKRVIRASRFGDTPTVLAEQPFEVPARRVERRGEILDANLPVASINNRDPARDTRLDRGRG
jgi:hypothetical protein